MGLLDGAMDKAKEAMNNEETSDKVLDKASDVAKDKLGEDKAGMVDKAREQADKRLGSE